MNTRKIIALLLAALFCATACMAEPVEGGESRQDLIAAGFFPISEVMARAGYAETGACSYETQVTADLTITVDFDPDGGRCSKNQYVFDLEDQFRLLDGELYLSADGLGAVLGCDVDFVDDEAQLTSHSYQPGDWTKLSRLIAHAGGAARGTSYNSVYTNSLEALIQNYDLGHRVFEFDFDLTSDGAIALVHDWKNYGMRNARAMSSEAWKAWKAYGNPVTRGCYTTMLMEDLLDQMLVNRDMFVVTDTKSMSISEEEVVQEFSMLRDAVMARDPELFDRIIPQVYDPDTYDLTMSVYPWRSVIYTTYENELPADEIIAFAAEKANIHVITASHSDARFTGPEIEQIHQAGLLFYSHTLNDYSELTKEFGRGVDGLYTDLLVQDQVDLYEQAVAIGSAIGNTEPDSPEDLYFLSVKDVSPTFEGFLEYCANLEDCVIFLAVKGNAMGGLSPQALDWLRKLGISTDLSSADGCSFCAAITADGVFEKAGYSEVSCSGSLEDGTTYELRSASKEYGNECSILIKGKEHASNKRGFNIVVYNPALRTVLHTGVYDTHG